MLYQRLFVVPQLTQDILDSGTILVYVKISNQIHQLNYYDSETNNVYKYVPRVAQLEFDTYWYAGGTPFVDAAQLRYVIIPSTTASVMQAQKVNFKDFNQVSQYLNLAK